jgi:photosystem II stability/assembly factor-like uncharacterized protein
MSQLSRLTSLIAVVGFALGCVAANGTQEAPPSLLVANPAPTPEFTAPIAAFNAPPQPDSPRTLTRPLTRTDLRTFAWRSIGPANMGGRVADLAFAPSDDRTFFVAYATGGLFKTTNRGTTLTPVFDDQHTTSIGAVAVADAPADWPGWSAEDAALTDDERAERERDRAERRAKDPEAFDKAEAEKGLAKIVWVGTGEGNNRNSSSWGHGVYRSTDGGATFEHKGLADTHNIPQIALDPRDPDTCFVAAMGHLWDENPERGLYKTTDGGETWRPVLQIDDATGCCDVVIDPADPDTMYAAMYTRTRKAWSYTSGSEVGGIFKSTDAGETWTKLTNGLPARTERIGLAVHKANPRILAALVASDQGGWGAEPFDDFSKEGGVFRSDDGGETWQRVSPLTPRAFYFSRIAIDPQDPDRVYLPGWTLLTSDDGGRTFRNAENKKPHVDFHAFVVSDDDPDHLLAGSDGGAYQSFDRGSTWQYINTVAAGQFYNIAVDRADPYRIAGGLQDNGTWIGPSRTRHQTDPDPFMGSANVGITNHDWYFYTGGDGFHVAFELGHPEGELDYFYSESQGGYLNRTNLTTGEQRMLRPSPKEGQEHFRFNWNAPFFISPHDHTTLYLGGNYVFKLTDRAERWAKISPDLSTRAVEKVTTVGSEAETHGTVVSLAESELAPGMLWAGTDDGRIHLTTDDGAAWRDVTPDAVAGRYIARLEPSRFDRDTAYAAVDGHRTGDYTVTLLQTTDAGATWTDITGDLPPAPEGGCAKVVREDRQNPAVLYCGTERGVFVTFDRGAHWLSLTGITPIPDDDNDNPANPANPDTDEPDRGPTLPHVPVDDIVIHPLTHDLVIATHGRSIYILDDASFLGQITPEVLTAELHAFAARPARPRLTYFYDGFYGDNFFTAPNPPAGAQITYWVGADHLDDATIEIKDADGELVRELSGPGRAGVHRVAWDLQLDTKKVVVNPAAGPAWVEPGEYTVTIKIGDDLKSETTVEVLALE